VTELGAALLQAALGFAEQRLHEVDDEALGSATALATALGCAPPADPVAVDAELALARQFLQALQTDLGQPPSQAVARRAATDLGQALQHIDDAINLVRPGTNLRALLDTPFAAVIAPTGLAAQLGLSAPSGLTYDGGLLGYRVTSTGPGTMPGPVPLHLGSVSLAAQLNLSTGALSLVVTIGQAGFSLGVGFDSFIHTLVGGGSSVTADVTIGADTERGLTVAGATSGPVTVPARTSSNSLDVLGLELAAPAEAPGAIDLGAELTATLGGVITFALQGVGVRVMVDADRLSSGSPATIAVKPPRGIGVTLDAGPVQGGGYLEVAGTTYEGLLQVTLGPVQATAFGILDTAAADTGFSFIVVITAEFDPAIEIALGFTLNGVGGLVGVQRTFDSAELLDRIHDHAVDQLLFPADAATAAPQILRTLGAVFPARAGGFVIGPMIKLGWGRPVSFVTASLAIILQLPDPKIALLGTFELAVPSPSLPIVSLKGQVFSEITPEHILVLIILDGSRIAGYPVSGDLGIYIGYGADPDFAISAGGFHPQYHPPAELASMQRLSMDLSPPVVLVLRAEAYVAFTSNSFQLGGRLEASADLDVVSVHGFVQLDAILRWAPAFSFEVDLSAGFDIRFEGELFAGVQVSLHLSGPAPWTAHGTATLELPIVPDIDVEVGPITWGDSTNPPPPIAHPRDLVRDALVEPAAWQAVLPAEARQVVTLRDSPQDPPLLIHPSGELEGRQRAVPLETTISRVGPSTVPAGETRVNLGQPMLTQNGVSIAVGAVSPLEDHFAPGQFLELTDEEKLRRPAFEDMLAGVRLGANAGGVITAESDAMQSDLHYDTVFPGMWFPGRFAEEFFSMSAVAFAALGAGAAGRSPLRRDVRYATPYDPIELAPAAAMRIRTTGDLGVPAGLDDVALSYTAATERLRSLGSPGLQLVALGTELG
jgi:hypothetical protein